MFHHGVKKLPAGHGCRTHKQAVHGFLGTFALDGQGVEGRHSVDRLEVTFRVILIAVGQRNDPHQFLVDHRRHGQKPFDGDVAGREADGAGVFLRIVGYD